MNAVLVCLLALSLDHWLGEPRRAHPLVAFGRLANALERRMNPLGAGGRLAGGLALALLVLPPAAAAGLVAWLPGPWRFGVELLLLYLAIGMRSLAEHAWALATPLRAGHLAAARRQAARMVSRDTQALDARGVAAAGTESTLENGADAVMASLFWYLVAGPPGLILHRLVNTLDAMWGYRNPRFRRFGWVAARFDDMLGWLPARLTALGYALAGDTRAALACWRRQAKRWPSPNAGPVMAAGAGALRLRLGGPAPYHGQWRRRPLLGLGARPDAGSPQRVLRLVWRGVALWLMVIVAGAGLWHWRMAAA